MTTNAWDKMERAKEDEYFNRKNQEALARLAAKKSETPRMSPISGKPMEQVVINGVVVDRCPQSGGIWLDQHELEQFFQTAKNSEHIDKWVDTFVTAFGFKK